jgi:hypothetical protein
MCVVAVAGPGRRNDDGAIDAGCRHLAEHLFRAKPVGPVRRTLLRLGPRAVRPFGLPEMDLNIRHRHFFIPVAIDVNCNFETPIIDRRLTIGKVPGVFRNVRRLP